MDDFPQKLKKVVRIVLYRPAISQSDCMKAGPYQLQYNNNRYIVTVSWKTFERPSKYKKYLSADQPFIFDLYGLSY